MLLIMYRKRDDRGGIMKHKRVTNRRIKQMMEDINHDGLFDEVLSDGNSQSLKENQSKDGQEVPPNLNLDSENK
ncbi:hypothetical protein GCM10007086_09260 [Photobacterium aphoticum]|uniref:Uncharacterized protein n=2 Tax=Photobacterium aphoticum TaxID=754436 RepID=A0A0J1GNV1_9GAMM|nr:hypothetical protein ABT58_09980 [Photobacterium aphoticum]PSU57665.1 hypothetical protein C9I90_09275 [Photobacterium aphoticum]GHA37963.1 hypothetical protein GCM10007086_09260 [Photobacterium aphoticum]